MKNGENWWSNGEAMVNNGEQWWTMLKNGEQWWTMVKNGETMVKNCEPMVKDTEMVKNGDKIVKQWWKMVNHADAGFWKNHPLVKVGSKCGFTSSRIRWLETNLKGQGCGEIGCFNSEDLILSLLFTTEPSTESASSQVQPHI